VMGFEPLYLQLVGHNRQWKLAIQAETFVLVKLHFDLLHGFYVPAPAARGMLKLFGRAAEDEQSSPFRQVLRPSPSRSRHKHLYTEDDLDSASTDEEME
jgi:hypothetical protein